LVACLVSSKSPWQGSAWALFCDVPTYDVKVIEFQSFYEYENYKSNFILVFIVATAQSTLS